MSNKKILIAIFVVLLGILALVALEYSHDTPIEDLSEGVNEVSEEVNDKIGDVKIPN